MSEHAFVWLELSTYDPEAVREFYAAMFDWKANEGGDGQSHIMLGEGVGATLRSAGAAPSGWIPFVSVPDVKAAVKKAIRHGAKVIEDVTKTPHGTRAIILDPAGSRLALWQAPA